MRKLLLDDDPVNDFVDAVDLLCKLFSSLLLLLAGGESAQLNGSIRRSDIDSGEFVNRVSPECALDFRAQLMIGHLGRYALDCRTAEGPCSHRRQREHQNEAISNDL